MKIGAAGDGIDSPRAEREGGEIAVEQGRDRGIR
jgi:hypothetical protein